MASGGGALACPTFADIDGDGDFDAFLVGDYYGNIVYAENIGTNTSPSFGVMVQGPFGLTASPNLLLGPNMIDLDNDGDLDLLAGNIYGSFVYYENTTSPLCPSPINLSSGNLTSTTADLVWTSSNAGVTYALEYGPKGFVPGTGTTVTGTSVVGVNTRTVTGITGSTLYEFYIKEDCGLGNLSSNVGPSVFSPVPVNDDCSNGAPISCGQIIQYTTIGAMSDNVVDCIVGNGSGGGVWYTIVGDGSTLKASLCASTFDTQIRVFTGTCSSLVCVTGNDDFCGFQSEVTWTSVNGTAYSILVYGFDNLEGNFTLNMCNAVVGIEDGEQLGKFKIFPNPAHDLLNVQWPGSTLSGPIKLEIFDAMGRSVYHANYPEHGSEGHYAETINVSNLLRGVYFVSILAGDQVISQKFIVE